MARQYGGHIQGLRWTLIQNQVFDIATQLGYSIPPGLNVHTIMPPPSNSKEASGINPTPSASRGQQYHNSSRYAHQAKAENTTRGSSYSRKSYNVTPLLELNTRKPPHSKTQYPTFPSPTTYNQYYQPFYGHYVPTQSGNATAQHASSHVPTQSSWSHDQASAHAHLYHTNSNHTQNWWYPWYSNI